jgi:hypothetical protein
MPSSTPLTLRAPPAILLTSALFAFGLFGCSVYDSSLLDAAAAPLSSAGDDGLGGASSFGGTQGNAGLSEDAGGAAAITDGVAGYGGAAGEAGAGDAVEAGNAGSGSGVGTGGLAGAGSNAAGSSGTANGAGGSGGSAPATVELAAGKKATASSYQTGNEIAKGNDGDLGTKWCASDGTFPQWWRVDLGAVHSLNNFSVTWEHPDRKYTYIIETSQNDSVYVLQSSLSGTAAVQGNTFAPGTSARYVRVTVTAAAPATYSGVIYATWASFFELSVTGT